MPSASQVELQDIGQTSGATSATYSDHTLNQNTSLLFTVKAVARKINGATKGFVFNGVAKRDTGNASVSQEATKILTGSTTDLLELLTADINVEANGTDLRVRLTGVALSTIDWWFSVDMKKLSA